MKSNDFCLGIDVFFGGLLLNVELCFLKNFKR